MKYFLFIIPLLLWIPSISYAQNNSSKTKCKKCRCVVDKLYSLIAKLDKIPYKKGHKITSMSYVSSSTLSDSSGIRNYFNKISNKQNWYYTFDRQPNKLALKQWEKIQSNKKQKARSFLTKKIRSALTIGSKVYTVKVKTEDGRILTDYVICNPNGNSEPKLTYDNIFFGLLNMRIEKRSYQTTTTIDSASVND